MLGEGIAAEEEAEGLLFVPQALPLGPRSDFSETGLLGPPEHRHLGAPPILAESLAILEDGVDAVEYRGPVGMNTVEGSSSRHALQYFSISSARIDFGGEVEHAAKLSRLPPRRQHGLDSALAHALDGAKAVANLVSHHGEHVAAFVDVRGQEINPHVAALCDVLGDRVG